MTAERGGARTPAGRWRAECGRSPPCGLARGPRPRTRPSTQAEGAAQLVDEEVALVLEAVEPAAIVVVGGFHDLRVEVLQPLSILGSRLSRRSPRRHPPTAGPWASPTRSSTCTSRPGSRKSRSRSRRPFESLARHDRALVLDREDLALAAEDVRCRACLASAARSPHPLRQRLDLGQPRRRVWLAPPAAAWATSRRRASSWSSSATAMTRELSCTGPQMHAEIPSTNHRSS